MRASDIQGGWLRGIIEKMPAQQSSPGAHALGYVMALALVLGAFGMREALGPPELNMPYFTFFPAIVLAAVFGGAGPGMLATVVGAVVATHSYVPPYGMLQGKTGAGLYWPNAMFVLGGAMVCIAIQAMHTYFRNYRDASSRLAKSRELLQAIIEEMPDAVFVKDAAGRYLIHNRAASKIVAKDPADIIGKDTSAIFPPEVAQAIMADDRSIMASRKIATYEERITSAAGEEHIFSTTKGPLFDESGNVSGLFGIARDITQGKRVEAAMLDRLAMQDQLTKIAATVPGVICSFKLRPDGTQCFPYASAAFEELYGIDLAEVKDDCTKLFARIHAEDVDRVDETIANSARDMAPWHAEFRYLHPCKGLRWIEGRSMPLREADGSILWHGFVYDVTGRKQIEAELIAAKQVAEATNASKSRFLAAASHDLRQPLQAISLFINVLKRTALSEEQQHIGRNLDSSVKALGELLDTLLDISKLDAGIVRPQRTRVDIGEIFGRTESEFTALASEKNLRFKLFLPRRSIIVDTDAKLLMSILRNVVGNAVRYTERGGILVGARLQANRLAVQIWDTGIGISSEYLTYIYDEFFQVDNPHRDRNKGFGLGLSIVKRLAALLGYQIECRSRRGCGTVVEIGIPLESISFGDGRKEGAPRADGGDYSCLRGRRVALIEDDYLVSKALETWLMTFGMRVSAYASADEALSDASLQEADFYVSDFRLPGAINGSELLDAVQRRSPRRLKALLITGDMASEQIDGRWLTLYKPVEPSKLLATLVSLERA